MKRVSIFGSAFKYGQCLNGVDKAPYKLKELGLGKIMEKHGYFIDNYDICYPNNDNIIDYSIKMAKKINDKRKTGNIIINIGGDHSVAIGSVNGVLSADPETVVIWVDAHGDINTRESSITGNIHGMPVAYLTGLDNHLSESKYLNPKLSFDSIAYIGIRDLDPYEEMVIDKSGILNYTSEDIKTIGIPDIMNRTINYLDPKNNKPIHLSFDIDALDPLDAPGTGVKVNDGISVSDAHGICDYLNKTGRVIAMDMVEVNPELDKDDKTSKLALSLIETVFK